MALLYPLIVTLRLDDKSLAFFDERRRLYFPAERNFLKAHLTLFHHLPPQHHDQVVDDLKGICQRQEVLQLEVSDVRMIGRGVAYKLENAELLQLHRRLQHAWQEWLTPQDKQRIWPHVTVQNKVQPGQAQELHRKLTEGFQPFVATGLGLQLWAYKGGPWELLQEIAFGGGV